MNEQKTPSKGRFETWRVLTVYGLIALVFGFYIVRLFSLQIVEGTDYQDQATENRVTKISIPTQRGIIYDRNGYVLARNAASYNVTIVPAELPADEGAVQEIFRQLSQLINVPVSNGVVTDESAKLFTPCQTDLGITEIVTIGDNNWPYRPIQITCDVDETIAMVIREKERDWPGVSIEVQSVRDYPTGSLTSEIIGFLGPIPEIDKDYYTDLGFVLNRDKVGYAGVEASLQDILGGRNGERLVEVDNAGQEIRDLETPINPVSGNNIKLTIDTRLQAAAKASLEYELNYWNSWLGSIISLNGAVIAMNPKTGEVLALVSFPTYENNRMARLIPAYYYNQLNEDPYRPLFNHAISAEHPPGSVFKMATAVGILNEGVVTLDKTIEDPGKITITEKFSPNDPGRPREYVCHKRDGHGTVDFMKGVAQSCDVYFYKVGGGYAGEIDQGLGIWRIGEYARALGYGAVTGIELPGEADGLIPDPTWKRLNIGENWSTGDTYIATIGQGYVLATPLQMLVSISTLANDGKMMKPTLVKEVLDAEGHVVKPFSPTLVRDITKDPVISVYDEDSIPTGEKISVQPWVIEKAKEAMRLVVTDGTATSVFQDIDAEIPSAGKTGTAEYCDNVAQAKNLCQFGSWPAHAWYAGYAPYDDPEIAVVAFVYNGKEGSTVAGPIVRRVMEAYFELKKQDAAKSGQP